ncbi:MAG: AHH domain-containing protein [Burkholderiales bacterium]
MTEIGEMVAVALSAQHTKESCYFCREKEHGDQNYLIAEEEEDGGANPEASNYQKNRSGMLAQNIGAAPEHRLTVEGETGDLRPGAHHLIPGNAALKPSAVRPHLGTQTGTDVKNVGYNVNSRANGVWLPGNYAVRPWSTRLPRFQRRYAYAAMLAMDAQFHDAHTRYSETVRMALNACAAKVEFFAKIACPECRRGGGEQDPPYAIVARLNAISGYLDGKVTGDPAAWRVDNLFTSTHVVGYHKVVKRVGKPRVRKMLGQ